VSSWEVRVLAHTHDLDPVRVDVVQVADQVSGRLRRLHGFFVEVALGVGVAGDPFPAQRGAVGFEQRLGADDGEVFEAHRQSVGKQ